MSDLSVIDSWRLGRHILIGRSSLKITGGESFHFKPLLQISLQRHPQWNKECFGNIFHKKKVVLTRLDGLQKALETHTTKNLRELDKSLREELEHILTQEELLWLQRPNSDWGTLRDRNTKYFHARKKCRIVMGLFLEEGSWCEHHETLDVPLHLKTRLVEKVSLDEIKGALFQMALLKSPWC
ncbi:hypothetical protein Sjap_023527 [Stephania japonica]|uniref:Uncharacterized protein n=1 Tax=Stephania japonica TaxID=461633 RepID=A0AAP0EDW4_9MAGN